MHRHLRSSILALSAATFVAGPSNAEAQSSAATTGTIVIAHGGGPSWDSRVDSVALAARTGGPVAVSLLMGPGAANHRFQDAVAALAAQGAREIVVVPLFVSSHSGHIDQIRYLAGQTDSLSETMKHHLAMSGITRATAGLPMRVVPALDDSPQLARVLADHATALATAPARQALFLVGHGPNSAEDNAEWMRALRTVADSVRRWTPFRDVKVGLVRDDAPAEVRAEAVRGIRETIQLQSALTAEKVVVVPILVSAGSVSRDRIPADLAGLPVQYNAVPLLPHPAMTRWIEARVRDAKQLSAVSGSVKAAEEMAPHSHEMH